MSPRPNTSCGSASSSGYPIMIIIDDDDSIDNYNDDDCQQSNFECPYKSEVILATERTEASVEKLRLSIDKLTKNVMDAIQALPPIELFSTPEQQEQMKAEFSKVLKYKKKLPEATLARMREEMKRLDMMY